MLIKSRGIFVQAKTNACGRHIDHGVVGGTPKSTKNQQTPQDTCSKNPGACFSEVGEAPQAAPHTHTLLGDPKTGKKTSKLNNTQHIDT